MKRILCFSFLLCMFVTSMIYSQTFWEEKVENDSSLFIDGTPLLNNQEEMSIKYYTSNPEFLQKNKIKKTSGWNFSVGDKKLWYSVDFTTEIEYPTKATCRAVGKYCYVFVQDSVWNENINQRLVDSIAAVFDERTPANSNKGIYETNTEVFGEPPDIDNDQKIIIYLLDIKDNSASGSSIVGFFSSANELPVSEYNLSNEAEIIFIDVNPSQTVNDFTRRTISSVIVHEFQHLISWKYNKDSKQWTFIKEGCSLAAEVINGYPIYRELYYSKEPNHYLFDWRSNQSTVLNDYSRASKFHVYLYEQFGKELFKLIVQGGKIGLDSYRNAFQKMGLTLSLEEVVTNCFLANIINNSLVDGKYGYKNEVYVHPAVNSFFLPPKTFYRSVESYGVEYIVLAAGNNLDVEFSSPKNTLVIKGILSGKGGTKIVDVNPNSKFSDSEFGNKYERCIFMICNLEHNQNCSFEFKYAGNPSSYELKWVFDRAYLRYLPNPTDTVGISFDAIPNGRLDSIRIGVYRNGPLTAKIYRLPCEFGAVMPSSGPIAITSLLSTYSNKEVVPRYTYPYPNTITFDFHDQKISTDYPFIIGLGIPQDTSNYPGIMFNTVFNNQKYVRYSYSASAGCWTSGQLSTSGILSVPMVIAYVSVEKTNEIKAIEPRLLEYSLMQNYPNPFNPETKISFSLPKKGMTTIKVFDLMGREVKTLLNEVKEAGNHEISFTGDKLSSGTYFYRIQSEGFVCVKKMILLR